MNSTKLSNRQLTELVKTYWACRWMWVLTTVAFASLGLFYVLFLKSDTWVASQGLIVRDEANGATMRLGRFQSQTDMKAAQETVLEMARNPEVLRAALTKVGREPTLLGANQNDLPTFAEVDELAKNGIEVRAPRGAELGTTEVIYLDVKQPSRTRALALNKAVCDALENQLQAVRQTRADGVIAELTTARDSAEQALLEATERLQLIEGEAGADLSDLRGLTDSNTGGNTNRQLLDTIKSELRKAELERHQLEIDLGLAKESFENADHLLLTPSRLVNNQPGLKRLREGLADAAIATSGLKGKFSATHPIVLAAVETEAQIRDQLREELGLSIQSLAKDLEITDKQIGKLRSQQDQLESRLAKLAHIRADYSNVVSEVRSRNSLLQETQRELAQAMASRSAALTSSLVTRLDAPLIGERPIGPGRPTILAGATLSGLLFGLGLVFLLSPLDGNLSGRRRYDSTRRAGRREVDQAGTDPAQTSIVGPADGALAATSFTSLAAALPSVASEHPRPQPSTLDTRAEQPPGGNPPTDIQPLKFAEICNSPPQPVCQVSDEPTPPSQRLVTDVTRAPEATDARHLTGEPREANSTCQLDLADETCEPDVTAGTEAMEAMEASPLDAPQREPAGGVATQTVAEASLKTEEEAARRRSIESAQAVIAAALKSSFAGSTSFTPTPR